MNKKYRLSLFIFRQDLRLEDNKGLIEALKASTWVIPCYIFDPRDMAERYQTKEQAQFLVESLEDLKVQLEKKGGHLYIVYGETERVVRQVVKEINIDAVWLNHLSRSSRRERDWALELMCTKAGTAFKAFDDCLFRRHILSGRAEKKSFVVWHKWAQRLPVPRPKKNVHWNYYQTAPKIQAQKVLDEILVARDSKLGARGGRGEGLKLLKEIKKSSHTRKSLLQLTARLMMHLECGTISAREAYHAIRVKLGQYHPLLRKMYQQDFLMSQIYHPSILRS
jgi:deoxyribodipyrimidine photo-lyase